MTKKWVVSGCLLVGAPLLASLLSKPAYVAPAGETRVCAWPPIAVDVRSTPSLVSDENGDRCVLAADGLKLDLQIFDTSDPDKVINMKALKAYYRTASGATGTPTPALSSANLLSLPYLLFGNRLPLTYYSAQDRQRGYLVADLTGSLVLAGLWVSDQPLAPADISSRIIIRIVPEGRALLLTLWIKLIYLIVTLFSCLPLAVAWFSRSIFRSVDHWWNVRTAGGLIVYGLLIPLALLGFLWLVLLFTGWSTGLLLATSFAAIALLQIARELIADRGKKLPLNPDHASDPPVFSKFRAATDTVEILNVEVPFGHSVAVELWLPRAAHCAHCGMKYNVYVPAKATVETRDELTRATIYLTHPQGRGYAFR